MTPLTISIPLVWIFLAGHVASLLSAMLMFIVAGLQHRQIKQLRKLVETNHTSLERRIAALERSHPRLRPTFDTYENGENGETQPQ